MTSGSTGKVVLKWNQVECTWVVLVTTIPSLNGSSTLGTEILIENKNLIFLNKMGG